MFQESDIIEYYGRSTLSRAISFATGGGGSHVAMIVNFRGTPTVFESTSLESEPCLWRGTPFKGCQLHEPIRAIRKAILAGGRVNIWRMNPMFGLRKDELERLSAIALWLVEQDISYPTRDAVLSASRTAYWFDLIPNGDYNAMFCSELLCNMLKTVNRANWGKSKMNPSRLISLLNRDIYYKLAEVNGSNLRAFAAGQLISPATSSPWETKVESKIDAAEQPPLIVKPVEPPSSAEQVLKG